MSTESLETTDVRTTMLLELEALAYNRLASRGLGGLDIPGAYHEAAKVLIPADRVLILTGFPIRGAALGETDGPPGALAVGYALERLGKQVIFVTDPYSAPLLEAGRENFDLKAPIYAYGPDVTPNILESLYEAFDPQVVFSIERPGKAADGHCHSMRGEVISDLTPSLDLFFELAFRDHRPTLAIGDGGNEIGMGALYDQVVRQVPNGEKIAAVTAADILMPAAVSNWGAYVLVGALSVDLNRNLLISAREASALLHTMVDMGAVDGATRLRDTTVDGYSYEENQGVLIAAHAILLKGLQQM